MFWPQTFYGTDPEFLDLHYKIQSGGDHAAKFYGDRQRQLGASAILRRNITTKKDLREVPHQAA